MAGWILLAVAVGLGLYLVVLVHGLGKVRNRTETAWTQIDVQLRRRHDLILNLVETVQGDANHEREALGGWCGTRG